MTRTRTTTSAERRHPIASVIVVVALAMTGACATAPRHSDSDGTCSVSDGSYAMGTVLEVELLAANAGEASRARAAIDEIFRDVEVLEAKVSRWRASSETSQLAARAGQPPFLVSDASSELIDLALRAHAMTDGSFDVSVGPLLALWAEAEALQRWPEPQALTAARAQVGLPRVLLRERESGALALAHPGMSLDFGGLAKGFALARAGAALRASGFSRGLLSFGQSSVAALGAPDGAEGWRLHVETPAGPRVLILRDRALSVSSAVGQWREVAGRRISHVVDPRTGLPADAGRHATVVAVDAAMAEVWSTALLVLPAAEGIAMIDGLEGVEAEVVTSDPAGGGFAVLRSAGFERATEPAAAR